jgi:hypothetical protein
MRLCATRFLLLLLTTTACTSTLTAHRIDPRSPAEPADINGLVIQLTVPEFTLTQTPPSATTPDNTYTINLTYRPDPQQRYGVNLHAAILHEGDFKLTLGTQGQVTQLNSAVREQLTPAITALGQFTASLVGTAAKFAAFDLTSDIDRAFTRVCTGPPAPALKPGDVCIKPPSLLPKIFDDDEYLSTDQNDHFHIASPSEHHSLNLLVARMKIFQLRTDLANSFFPQDSIERHWLLSALVAAKISLTTENKEQDRLRDVLIASLPSSNDLQPALKALLLQYNSAVSSAAIPQALTLQTRIQNLLKPIPTATTPMTQYFLHAQTLLDLAQDKTLLEPLTTMSNQEWRSRKAAALEALIAPLEHDAIASPLTPVQKKRLEDLQQELDRTIDATDQRTRAAVLRSFLSSIPQGKLTSLPPLMGPTMNEYSIARAEYEALLSTIQQKRTALQTAPPKAKQLVTRVIRPTILWCHTGPSDDQIVSAALHGTHTNCSPDPASISTSGNDPDFVIVIEHGARP